MSFFKKISKEGNLNSNDTTRNFYLGSAEAEGESTTKSRIKLNEVFEDYLNVFPQLETEKFIITGRKGSGKTAIAEFIIFQAYNHYEVFADFIKMDDIDLEKIIQIGKEQNYIIENKLIFEWQILIKLLNLLIENETIKQLKGYSLLKTFLEVNRGFINLDRNQINEITYGKNLEIDVTAFQKYVRLNRKTDILSKESKAPFYKLIPNLKETIRELLESQTATEYEYYLIFDDLDIGFKESNTDSIDNINNLLRLAKQYNIDFFGKNGFPVKIIILLRDDIKKIISKHSADSAKVFASYEIMLKWYDHTSFKYDENLVHLKKFITRRIELNFIENKMEYDVNDPWGSFIDIGNQQEKTNFKYILDQTFYRPRDLILFFKNIGELEFKLPISKFDIQILIKKYKELAYSEIRNELSASFSPQDISAIIKTLKEIKSNFTFDELKYQLEKNGITSDLINCIYLLFEYSLIGNIDTSNFTNKFYFKHREDRDDSLAIDQKLNFITHIIFN